MNILIPMGGKGLRLQNYNAYVPKPLIEVDGAPMFQRVIESIKIDGKFHFVVRKEHIEKYHIDEIINNMMPSTIHILKEDNDGQVETCLVAKESINNDEPLLIVNCDNYLVWDSDDFNFLLDKDIDGAAFTFIDSKKNLGWCFAKVDDNNFITKLAEKQPISDIALAGGFYWRKGSDFVKYAEKLISNNIRAHNGEFYLGSVFNLAIQDNKKILNYPIKDMKCCGTPEGIKVFEDWLQNKNIQFNIESNFKEDKMSARNIQDAIEALQEGKPIIIIDQHDRENEGDIVLAGEKISSESLIFTINNARGLMCIACDGYTLDRLDIPLMVAKNTDNNETPFTVSVDAAKGTTTGMSVYDRLKTIKIFIDDNSQPQDLNRPGHLFPLRAKDGLLKDRKGHTEAAVTMMRLAELKPVSVICEIMNNDGTMAKGAQINKFAMDHEIILVSIEEIYEAFYNESL